MATQYRYRTQEQAIAQKRRLERLGHTVFTPYYQPHTLFHNGEFIPVKGGTWNIIEVEGFGDYGRDA